MIMLSDEVKSRAMPIVDVPQPKFGLSVEECARLLETQRRYIGQSLIVSFEGVQGTGKSTGACATAIEAQSRTGRKIVSNNHIYVANWQQFSLQWLKENLAGNIIEDIILIMDETTIVGARDHATNTNKFFTDFITTVRKRKMDLYLCTHFMGNIDIKLQRAIDIRGACNTYTRVCKKCRCKACRGTGFVKDMPCGECNGVGGTGWVGGEKCDECMGYGKVSETVMTFLNRRIPTVPINWPWVSPKLINARMPRRLRPIGIFANHYWPMFDTRERTPVLKKVLDRLDTAEVAL